MCRSPEMVEFSQVSEYRYKTQSDVSVDTTSSLKYVEQS